ncbi:MAG TPA: acyl-CoA dehydrogenase [Acidimicrobiaceae bacterium]|nr:acyl-CoA dehydrogenase [Acidimicrobiaceae bacterium]|tara:strand:- start:2988 stop:4157 length:1170 start_codon:yes stop_codon:yes gene_type:complete
MSEIWTSRRRELVASIAQMGPAFAARAGEVDREAAFPHENYADLREAGFLGLCIPESHGGLGGDFVTYALVSEELGRHCGSTALTFNMHTATTMLVGQIADDLDMTDEERAVHEERRSELWRGVIAEGRLHAQPFSEGLAPGETAGFAARAVPVDGGYLLTGRKVFASLSEVADLHNVTCMVEGDDRVRFLGVPADADGVIIEGDWDPLGMRGTNSRNLVFDGAFVPAENEFLPPGGFDQMATRWPYFYTTLTFTYLGIQRAVLDYTTDYLRGEGGTSERRDMPQKQHGWAQMRLAWERSQALTYRMLGEVGVDPSPEQLRRAWAATVTAMETAPEVASLAVRVCGGRSLLRPSVLERLYRDARCGATMLPWSVEVTMERLGRAGLYDD